MGRAYDTDLSAASSIDDSAVALQEHYGCGPANAQWEAFAQGRKGAAMVLRMVDGTDFDTLASRLRALGYDGPEDSAGVWRGGADVVAAVDGAGPTSSPPSTGPSRPSASRWCCWPTRGSW